LCAGAKKPRIRDKPVGCLACFDDGRGGKEVVFTGLLDVLVVGVGLARTGVEQRPFGNGCGTTISKSLRKRIAYKANRYVIRLVYEKKN